MRIKCKDGKPVQVFPRSLATPKISSMHNLNFTPLQGKLTDAVSHTKEKEMQDQMLTHS